MVNARPSNVVLIAGNPCSADCAYSYNGQQVCGSCCPRASSTCAAFSSLPDGCGSVNGKLYFTVSPLHFHHHLHADSGRFVQVPSVVRPFRTHSMSSEDLIRRLSSTLSVTYMISAMRHPVKIVITEQPVIRRHSTACAACAKQYSL